MIEFLNYHLCMQITTIVAGLEGTGAVKCSRDVNIVPDVALDSVDKDSFDVIVSENKCAIIIIRHTIHHTQT